MPTKILYLDAAFESFAPQIKKLVKAATSSSPTITSDSGKRIDLLVAESHVLQTMRVQENNLIYKLHPSREEINMLEIIPKNGDKIPFVLLTNYDAKSVQLLTPHNSVNDFFLLTPVMKKAKNIHLYLDYISLFENILLHKEPYLGRQSNIFNHKTNLLCFDYMANALKSGKDVVIAPPYTCNVRKSPLRRKARKESF